MRRYLAKLISQNSKTIFMNKIAPAFLFLLFFYSCKENKSNSLWSNQDCDLERLEFQEITDTIHRTKNGGLEGGVMINGKIVFNDKINLDTIKAFLNAGDKVFISQTTFKTVKVSQEFYEKYNSTRAFLCQTMAAMKSKDVSPETKARAEEMYLDLIEMNSGLSEKKDTSNNRSSNKVIINGNNYENINQTINE